MVESHRGGTMLHEHKYDHRYNGKEKSRTSLFRVFRITAFYSVIFLLLSNFLFIGLSIDHKDTYRASVKGDIKCDKKIIQIADEQDLKTAARSRDGNSNDWSMFGKDSNHTFFTSSPGPVNGDLLWSFDMKELSGQTAADVVSSPVVVNDTVYVCSSNYFMAAFDIDNGNLKWETYLENRIRSTPAYHDGELFVAAYNKVWKVNALNGSKQLLFQTPKEISSSPVIYNETIYISTLFSGSRMYALNISGEEKWNISMGDSLWGTPGTPALSGGVLYIGSANGWFYALDSDGLYNGDQGTLDNGDGNQADIIWSVNISREIMASPTIVEDSVIFGTFSDQKTNRLYSLYLSNGTEKWNTSTAARVQSTASYSPDTELLYLGTYGDGLKAIDAQTGSTAWTFDTKGESILSSPAVSNGVVYFGCFDNRLYAVDSQGNQNGSADEHWNFTTMDIIHSSPAVSRGRVFIGSNDDRIYTIGAPDLAVYPAEIVISDLHPFPRERVSIEANISNRGSLDTQSLIEIAAKDRYNNTVHSIYSEMHLVERGASLKISAHWRILDNPLHVWNIWVTATNFSHSEPKQNNNLAKLELTVSTELRDYWSMSGGGADHAFYQSNAPEKNNTLWKKELDEVLDSPIIYRDNAVINSNEGNIKCISLLTGQWKWNLTLGETPAGLPAAGYGKVFISTSQHLYALDIDGLENGNSGIVMGTHEDQGADILWRADLPEGPTGDIILAGGLIGLILGDSLLFIDEDSGLLEKELDLSADITTNMVAAENYFIYGDSGRSIYALHMDNFTQAWSREITNTSEISGILWPGSKEIIITTDHKCQGLDLYSGNISWAYYSLDTITTHPAYSAQTGAVYFITETKEIIKLSLSGEELDRMVYHHDHAVSLATGGNSIHISTVSGNIIMLKDFDVIRGRGIGDGNDTGLVMKWSYSTSGDLTPEMALDEVLLVTSSKGHIYCIGGRNQKPVATIDQPEARSNHFLGDEVTVNATGSWDPDGDRLCYSWVSSLDGELYSGYDAKTSVKFQTAGSHNLTLVVDDGYQGVSRVWKEISIFQRQRIVKNMEMNCCSSNLSLTAEIGGTEPDFILKETGNPSSIRDRDIGIFFSISKINITILDWIELKLRLDLTKIPFEINPSQLSFFNHKINETWELIPSHVDVGNSTITANISDMKNINWINDTSVFSIGFFHNNPPSLEGLNITPLEAGYDETFNLSVVYTDPDGDLPIIIILVIDDNISLMMKSLDSVNNTLHGKRYFITFDHLPPGNHTYEVRANDGVLWISSGVRTDLITFNPWPNAVITNPEGKNKLKVNEILRLDASSSWDSDDSVIMYIWTIKELNWTEVITFNLTGPQLEFEFTQPGLYSISLKVVDSKGHVSKTAVIDNIFVAEEKETADDYGELLFYSAIGALLILVILLLVFFRNSKKKEESGEIKGNDGEGDDLEYPGKSEDHDTVDDDKSFEGEDGLGDDVGNEDHGETGAGKEVSEPEEKGPADSGEENDSAYKDDSSEGTAGNEDIKSGET